eukprot:TRINITY_DN31713_c0_g1_i2.p1 TRINITY_DN31713_c0_g1~~TRINITY_DN31713_c0_g1_i2.p1  ORF type:complete len:1464 (+),score=269.20 TRINITY_DN31713_c0_g1_i2:26-4417(+)
MAFVSPVAWAYPGAASPPRAMATPSQRSPLATPAQRSPVPTQTGPCVAQRTPVQTQVAMQSPHARGAVPTGQPGLPQGAGQHRMIQQTMPQQVPKQPAVSQLPQQPAASQLKQQAQLPQPKHVQPKPAPSQTQPSAVLQAQPPATKIVKPVPAPQQAKAVQPGQTQQFPKPTQVSQPNACSAAQQGNSGRVAAGQQAKQALREAVATAPPTVAAGTAMPAPATEGMQAAQASKQLRGYACMTSPQLLELCKSLEKSRFTMEKLLAQLVNEQGKLLNHRGTLRARIAEVEEALKASEAADAVPAAPAAELAAPAIELVAPATELAAPAAARAAETIAEGPTGVRQRETLSAAPNGKTAADSDPISEVAAPADPAAVIAMTEPAAGASLATSETCNGDAAAGEGGTLLAASQAREEPEVVSPAAAPGESEIPTTRPENLESVLQNYSLDGSSEMPDSDTLQGLRNMSPRLQEGDAQPAVVNAPEELMAKAAPTGSIRLTWFYDEAMLERLAEPEARELLSFEIRQQSEGAGGRLRTRVHTCLAQLPLQGQEIGEQGFAVEGCAPGRVYTFSVRAKLDWKDQSAEPSYSEYCVPVNAAPLGRSFGGSLNAPSGMPMLSGSATIPLSGSMRAPASSLSSTMTSTQMQSLSTTCPLPSFAEETSPRNGPAKGATQPELAVERRLSRAAESQASNILPSLQDSAGKLRSWLVQNRLLPGSAAPSQEAASQQVSRSSQPSQSAQTSAAPAPATSGTTSLPAPVVTGAVDAASPASPSSSDQGFLRKWLRDRQQTRSPEQEPEPQLLSPATDAPTAPSSPVSGPRGLGKPVLQGPAATVPAVPSSFTAPAPSQKFQPDRTKAGSFAAAPSPSMATPQRSTLVESILQRAYPDRYSPTPNGTTNGVLGTAAVSPSSAMQLTQEAELTSRLHTMREAPTSVRHEQRSHQASRQAEEPQQSLNPEMDVTRAPGDLVLQEHQVSSNIPPLPAPCAEAPSAPVVHGAPVEAKTSGGIPQAMLPEACQTAQVARPQPNPGQDALMAVPRAKSFGGVELRQGHGVAPANLQAGSFRAPHRPTQEPIHAQLQQQEYRSPEQPQALSPQASFSGNFPSSSSFPAQRRASSHAVPPRQTGTAMMPMSAPEQLGGTRPLAVQQQPQRPQLNQGQQVVQRMLGESANGSLQTINSLPAPNASLGGGGAPGQSYAAPAQHTRPLPARQFSVPAEPFPQLQQQQLNFFAPSVNQGLCAASLSETANSLLGPLAGNPFTPQRMQSMGASFAPPLAPLVEPESELFKPLPSFAPQLDEAPPPRSAPGFEPPPPPRSAPSLQHAADFGRGMSNGNGARGDFPRWNDPIQSFGGMDFREPSEPSRMSRPPVLHEDLPSYDSHRYGGSGHGGSCGYGGSSGTRHVLQVRMADSRWESLNFSSGDDIERQGRMFIQKNGLKAAFTPGLLSRMQQMISIGQDYACADIVDLI